MTTRMTRRAALGLAMMSLLAVVPSLSARQDKAIEGDLKKLQGKWTFTLADGTSGSFEFDKTKAITDIAGQTYTSKVTLDDKAEPNKTIDFEITAGPAEAVGQTAQGIYKITDEGPSICIAAPGQARPSDFRAVEGEVFLFELKK